MSSFWKDRPFSHYLIASIFILVFVLVAGIIFVDYSNSDINFRNSERMLAQQTENNLVNSIVITDKGLKLFDNSLNLQMEDGFKIFLEEYTRAAGDPASMDLPALKQRLGGQMDLYIINADGLITYTTYEPEKGLDFKTTIPYFYEYLTKIRNSSGFFPDRVVQETATGKPKKFAYMPTPDHQYVLELGLSQDAFRSERNTLKYSEMTKRIAELNPFIEDIRIFTTAKRLVGNKSFVPDSSLARTLDTVLRDRESLEIVDPQQGRIIRYLYINLTDPDYAADMSLVAELTYNTAMIQDELNRLVVFHLMVGLVALIIGSGIAIIVSRRLTRPIEEIVRDVDQIAKGDYDHQISSTLGREFGVLEVSINTMVGSLKQSIAKGSESEEKIREYSQQLEFRVEERTRELQEATGRARLYLDILMHDISNANVLAGGYLQLLIKKLSGKEKDLAENAMNGIKKSVRIVKNVSTIYRLHQENVKLVPVALNDVIKTEISHFPETKIMYEPTGGYVMADDLLAEVFTNLIGNSAKYGGREVTIWLAVQHMGKEVKVTVEDNGPGIPDDQKSILFGRSWRGSPEKAGKGLGLFICRALVERYGGRIWVEDRVAGNPGSGVKFQFMLQKADFISPPSGKGLEK